MSFLEFDPRRFEAGMEADFMPEVVPVRTAWRILTSFGCKYTEGIELGTGLEDDGLVFYDALSTDSIQPLTKGREIFFDQFPVVNDEPVGEPGIFAMKVFNLASEQLDKQVIFRLETHPAGAAVFYDDMRPESQVTDKSELQELAKRLLLVEDVFWENARYLNDDMLLHATPRNELFDDLESLLLGDDQEPI